jgi:hypothetical protein
LMAHPLLYPPMAEKKERINNFGTTGKNWNYYFPALYLNFQ